MLGYSVLILYGGVGCGCIDTTHTDILNLISWSLETTDAVFLFGGKVRETRFSDSIPNPFLKYPGAPITITSTRASRAT